MPVWGQGALLGDTSLLPAMGAPQRSPTMKMEEKAKARSAGATTAAATYRHHATTHTAAPAHDAQYAYQHGEGAHADEYSDWLLLD